MAATKDATGHRAMRIYRTLQRKYPRAECALTHRSPWELLIATILSAQCTDTRVNVVTPVLFAKYPDAASLAAARQADVEQIIRSTGFYRSKAKSIIEAAKGVTDRFGGRVPRAMEELLTLRGVARKTANVVLGTAYGLNEGIVVDTHVKRLAHRMALTKHTDPRKVETDLMALFPRRTWTNLSHMLIWHGRRTCFARKPDCQHCVVNKECPKVGVKALSADE
jgi:endonuclease III